MAGAGYKLFNTGDVLTAAQVNTYLQEQTVMVFADSAARTTALSGVLAEGMMSYLQDTNAVEVYNGSAWTAVGGGGLTSPLTTKGDIWVYGTGDTRLPVGTDGHTLVADSVETTGLKWVAPAGGGSLTQLGTTTTLSGVSTTVSFTATGYQNLYVQVDLVNPNGDTKLDVEPNSVNNLVDGVGVRNAVGTTVLVEGESNTVIRLVRDKLKSGDTVNSFSLLIYNVASTTQYKNFTAVTNYQDDSNRRSVEMIGGIFKSTTAISSLKFQGTGSGYSGGSVRVYGVN